MGLQPYGTEAVANQVNKTGIVTEAVGMSAGQAIKTISFYCMFICGGLLALGANFNYQVPGFVNSIGYSPLVGGSVASTVMIGAIIGKFVLGYLNDKIGVKGASIVGLADGMLAMVLMLLAKMHIYLLYTGAFLFGFGFAMLTVVPPLIVRLIFGQKDYSAIYSYLSTIQAVMGAIAVFGFGWLYDVTNTFASSLIIVGASYAVCLVLIFIALKAGKSILESENKVQLRT
jgi:MFS family permease